MDSASAPSPRLAFVLGLLVVLGAIAFSTAVRVRTAFADPNFDTQRAEGMLKSDPGLLYYFTERILDANGGVPGDFRADPRVQHPGTTDIPAEFTVGQEFLCAWTYRWFGDARPLHVHCVRFMALVASLAVLGVFGLARELTRSDLFAGLAAVLFVLLPASYRTIGFILIREDLSFPLFAIHLWLFARAARLQTGVAWLLAGLAAAAALATWHAMTFIVALEALLFLVWFLATDRTPFRERRHLLFLVPVVVAGVLVPALCAKVFLLSPPMQIAGALAVVGLLSRRRARIAACLATWLGLFLLSRAVSPGDHAHVFDVVLAKLAHLGRLPDDPAALSFDARLLWQGPFETLELGWGLTQLFSGLLLGVPASALLLLRRTPRDGAAVVLALAALLSLPVAWGIGRLVILPGLLLPAVAAVAAARIGTRRAGAWILAGVLALQALLFAGFVRDHRIAWYLPPGQKDEIAALVRWIDAHLPPDEPIAADFMNSTAILAHTGRPIVLQPKYETDAARRRAEAFLVTFFEAPPEAMARVVRERFACRYVLFDRYTLGRLSAYAGGLPAGSEPRPGTSAAVFLGQDAALLAGVPGFELVYRSPATILQSNGEPYDLMRLYRVAD